MLHFLGRQGLAQLCQRRHGVHVDRAATFLHLFQHEVVAQAGGGNGGLTIRRVVVQHLLVLDHVVFAISIDRLGFEQQEPCADRAVAVLETGGHETVFHHGHLGTGFGSHRVGRTGVPHRVPCAALAFTHGTGTEQVHATASGEQDGLGFVDVNGVIAHREADCTGDAAGVVLVVDQFDDEDAFLDAAQPQSLLGSFGHDPLVGFAVDHDLPFAGTYRFAAVLQQRQAFLDGFRAVVAHAFSVGLPDRQTPFFEQVHRVIDIATEVVGQVVAGDTHQVVGDHARIIGRILLGADVGVDRGQTLRHGAGTVHRGLVHQLDLQFGAGLGLHGLCPAHHFVSGATASHTATDHQNIEVFFDDSGITKSSFRHFVHS